MVQNSTAAATRQNLSVVSEPPAVERQSRRSSDFMERIAKSLPEQVLSEETSHLHLIEARLTRLPEEILRGIEPWVIARKVNEALEKSIAETGIPATIKQLSLLSQQVSEVTGAFHNSARELIDLQDKVSDHSRHAIDRMQTGIEKSAGAAERAADRLSRTFLFQHRGSVLALTSAALVVGFLLGMLTLTWIGTPAQAAQKPSEAPAIVAAQPAPPPVASKQPGKVRARANQ